MGGCYPGGARYRAPYGTYNANDNDNGGDDDDVDLEKNLISAGGKPVASGSVGADVGSVGMAALILVLVLVLHK